MVGGRPKLVYSPGPGLWSLVLGPFGPDLGPDLGPGPGPELDNLTAFVIHSLKIIKLGLFVEKSFYSETEDKDFLINPFTFGVSTNLARGITPGTKFRFHVLSFVPIPA